MCPPGSEPFRHVLVQGLAQAIQAERLSVANFDFIDKISLGDCAPVRLDATTGRRSRGPVGSAGAVPAVA